MKILARRTREIGQNPAPIQVAYMLPLLFRGYLPHPGVNRLSSRRKKRGGIDGIVESWD
jgi:hypothetical protein